MPKIIDRTGSKFGKLTVLGLSCLRGHNRLCFVTCDCGTTKEVVQSRLTTKNKPVRSCGCLAKENHYRTHGSTKHKFYPVWRAMTGRCYNETNKSFVNYGGRGIDVCCEWLTDANKFIAWLEDNKYEKGLEIDRVDNNKGYSPENCRVVTPSENCRNRRNNLYVNFKGKKVLLIEIAEEYGIKYDTLRARVKTYGMAIEKAVYYKRKIN